MLKVYFDDFEISQFCEIVRAIPTIADSDEHIEMEIDIAIVDNVMSNLDQLNRILFTDEPKRLVISDYPNRYLMCKLSGGIKPSSRFFMSEITLKFVSEDKYWLSDEGEIVVEADAEGKFELDNRGTAPCVPKFRIEFTSESGFLALVSPNGYLTYGDKDEKDRIDIPSQEIALSESLSSGSIATFTKITDDTLIPDYNKLSLTTGVLKSNNWGLELGKATAPKAGSYWNSVAYAKDFKASITGDKSADNFRLNARLRFYDASGTTAHTGMYLIVLMDAQNRPVMTTSVYNIESNSNEVVITAKVNTYDGEKKSSKIVKTARFVNGFDGTIVMKKEGNLYSWTWDSGRTQRMDYTVIDSTEKFKVGNTVYIKKSARYGYHDNGTRYNIAGFTRGRPNIITGTRKSKGKTQYLISNSGVRIYWMNEEDLTKDRSGVGQAPKKSVTKYGAKIVNFDMKSSELATLKPSKLVVVSGVWDNSSGFSHANLVDVKISRLNGENKFKEIKNLFQKGDVLTIDNATGNEVLNGSTFTGLADYDNRHFDIDFGPNELQMKVSEWATMPKAKLYFEERYR